MTRTRPFIPLTAMAVALALTACQESGTSPDELADTPAVDLAKTSTSDAEATIRAMVDAANARLEAEESGYRIDRAFYYTAEQEAGQTIFFNNRTKQLTLHFVPGDPRRGGRTDIGYMVDQVQASNLPIPTTTAAIDRAMMTWEGVKCSSIPITQLPNVPGLDIGFAAGGFPAYLLGSDVTHAGWLPTLGPGVLGVAMPYIWVDGGGSPTDIDNNGKLDTALWEIYYSNAFPWADDGVSNFDVETIALHEAGHGLDQGHFGKLFRTDSNGKLHFAPRAVMNAGYTGPQRSIGATDNGGHCSIWGSWPNN